MATPNSVNKVINISDFSKIREDLADADSSARALDHGGGSGQNPPMESRVTRLEEWAKQSDQRMGRIEGKLDRIGDLLSGLPTRRDLNASIVSGIAIGLTVLALVVGGIIGGLSWVKPDTPIVLQPGQSIVPFPSRGYAITPAPAVDTPSPSPPPAKADVSPKSPSPAQDAPKK